MKNTVKINEGVLRKMIAESVRGVLSEISSGLIQKAVDASPEINTSGDAFKNGSVPFDWDYDTAANGIRYISDVLDVYEESYHGYNENAQINQCRKCLDYITKFLRRKSAQLENLANGAEVYRFKEEDSLYDTAAKLLGVNSKSEVDGMIQSMSDDEYLELKSKMPEDVKKIADEYWG